jgi:hypothetical protein
MIFLGFPILVFPLTVKKVCFLLQRSLLSMSLFVGCHCRCKVNPPTTEKETHLTVIYSLPLGNYFFFQKPSMPVGKGLLKEKMFSSGRPDINFSPIRGGSVLNR